MIVTAEFLIEPFQEGALGEHVRAAISAVETAGFTADVGPFGNSISGEHQPVIAALGAAMSAAIEAGATRAGVTVWTSAQ